MNQYIKFIVRVLLSCFFIAFLGVVIQVACGLQHYVWGLKIPHVEAISMFVAIALIQPALYIVYWRFSGRF